MDPERRETDPGTHEKMCCLPGLGGCVGMWTWESWGGGPSQAEGAPGACPACASVECLCVPLLWQSPGGCGW